MTTEKYFENDIGRALTAGQMAEYQEAWEAANEGRESKRLAVAANVCTVILVAGVLAVLAWALTH